MKNLLLILLLTSSLQSVAETNDSSSGGCIDVITYGLNPKTGEWRAFPTPCDVPKEWVNSSTRPSVCLDVIVYGKNPNTEEWHSFETPCDVPATWESKVCPDFVIYGQNSKTKNWYKFSTPCDIPNEWISSIEVPKDFQTKCGENATYSEQGIIHIPLLDYKISDTKTITLQDVELQQIDIPKDNALLFYLTKMLEVK